MEEELLMWCPHCEDMEDVGPGLCCVECGTPMVIKHSYATNMIQSLRKAERQRDELRKSLQGANASLRSVKEAILEIEQDGCKQEHLKKLHEALL